MPMLVAAIGIIGADNPQFYLGVTPNPDLEREIAAALAEEDTTDPEPR
jgi:hypothetical protein